MQRKSPIESISDIGCIRNLTAVQYCDERETLSGLWLEVSRKFCKICYFQQPQPQPSSLAPLLPSSAAIYSQFIDQTSCNRWGVMFCSFILTKLKSFGNLWNSKDQSINHIYLVVPDFQLHATACNKMSHQSAMKQIQEHWKHNLPF